MAERGAITSPARIFPSTSARSDGPEDIVLMNLEKDEKVHPLGSRVISEYMIQII
jgi:hypothetical protein